MRSNHLLHQLISFGNPRKHRYSAFFPCYAHPVPLSVIKLYPFLDIERPILSIPEVIRILTFLLSSALFHYPLHVDLFLSSPSGINGYGNITIIPFHHLTVLLKFSTMGCMSIFRDITLPQSFFDPTYRLIRPLLEFLHADIFIQIIKSSL